MAWREVSTSRSKGGVAMDRLSPLDASFLHLEDDVNHMHIGSVGIFEGPPPGYDELVGTVAGRLALVPRYRQKVAMVPLSLGRPVWVDDPHFNVEYHVRHTALPEPGGEPELARLVGRVMSQRLDRSKPLWEIWMAEGLEDGRWAMVSKVHHCLVDGVSGAELLAVLRDLSPDVSPPVGDRWRAAPPPQPVRAARDAVVDLATSPYEQMRAAGCGGRRPRRALHAVREIANRSVALSRIAKPTPPTCRWASTIRSSVWRRSARSSRASRSPSRPWPARRSPRCRASRPRCCSRSACAWPRGRPAGWVSSTR